MSHFDDQSLTRIAKLHRLRGGKSEQSQFHHMNQHLTTYGRIKRFRESMALQMNQKLSLNASVGETQRMSGIAK